MDKLEMLQEELYSLYDRITLSESKELDGLFQKVESVESEIQRLKTN